MFREFQHKGVCDKQHHGRLSYEQKKSGQPPDDLSIALDESFHRSAPSFPVLVRTVNDTDRRAVQRQIGFRALQDQVLDPHLRLRDVELVRVDRHTRARGRIVDDERRILVGRLRVTFALLIIVGCAVTRTVYVKERDRVTAIRPGETYSNATDAVEWIVPREIMTRLVIANERLR